MAISSNQESSNFDDIPHELQAMVREIETIPEKAIIKQETKQSLRERVLDMPDRMLLCIGSTAIGFGIPTMVFDKGFRGLGVLAEELGVTIFLGRWYGNYLDNPEEY